MEYIVMLALFVLGFVIAFVFSTSKNAKAVSLNAEKLNLIQKALNESERQRAVNEETIRLKTEENKRFQDELAQNLVLSNLRAVEVAKLKTLNDNLTEKLENQQSEIENQQKRLTAEFENIANKIMKQRSDEFSASNQKNIGDLLNPLKEKIQLFEKKVDETYDKELRDKISLKEEVRKLTELNARVSEEASNLTKALKGDVKKQGNWGEIILERHLYLE